MYRKAVVVSIILTIGTSFAIAVDHSSSQAKLSAAEIVDKNVSARGGLQAWRAIQSITMSGRIDAGGNNRQTLPMPGRKSGPQMPAPRQLEQVKLPLTIDLKRSHKSRIELQFNGQTAIQVFDGTSGWKLRPFLNRREVEPYTPEELKAAALMPDLDGPLIDCASKGSKVELIGTEKIGDRDTYKLALTSRDGQVQHIWVDSMSYLEVKIEGSPRRLDGKLHPVEVYYNDFRPTPGGVVLPYVYETKVEGIKQTEKIQIESVLVNTQLDDKLFAKPN
jgi:outer membrane lipoprotein-sorting protein